jgi:uncharacterized protein with NRDE domain
VESLKSIQLLPNTIYGMSNGIFDTWKKVENGKQKFEKLLREDLCDVDEQDLQTFYSDIDFENGEI